jgi:hypothetical protein
MLFPRNALASGPQADFYLGERIEKVKLGKLFYSIPKRTKK